MRMHTAPRTGTVVVSARPGTPVRAHSVWQDDTHRVRTISTAPTVSDPSTVPAATTNLVLCPTTGFGFKAYHQRPKEALP